MAIGANHYVCQDIVSALRVIMKILKSFRHKISDGKSSRIVRMLSVKLCIYSNNIDMWDKNGLGRDQLFKIQLTLRWT